MDDAELDLGLWPDGADCVGQALETVAAHNEGVLDAAVAQLGQKRHPEFGALATGGSDSQAQHVAFALEVDAHGHLDGPVGHLAIADRHDDGVDHQHG